VGQSGFPLSVTMNNVPVWTEVNVSTQSDTEITPIKEMKRICGVGEAVKRFILRIYGCCGNIYSNLSVYFIDQTQSRAVFCMHVFVCIWSREGNERNVKFCITVHTRTYIWTCHKWKSRSLRKNGLCCVINVHPVTLRIPRKRNTESVCH
jgi:hypothetical protein